MKNISILLVLLSGLYFSSCSECITCQIVAHSYDDTLYIDTTTINYEEFCGSLTEVEAFEADVQFNAENRSCVHYSIRKYSNDEAIANFYKCGSIQDIIDFVDYLESDILNGTYIGQDVYLKLEETVSNPGTYTCH